MMAIFSKTFFFQALLVFGAMLHPLTPSAQGGPPNQGQVVFSDSFESGTGNWTEDWQNDWFSSTQRASDGSTCDGCISNRPIRTKAQFKAAVRAELDL